MPPLSTFLKTKNEKSCEVVSTSFPPSLVLRGLNCLVENAKNDTTYKRNPSTLSHYRVLNINVTSAYDLFHQGAGLVRATSTKYALIGSINRDEQTKMSDDLLRGCELIGAATFVTLQESSGCSRAIRQYNQKAALSIYIATLRLIETFTPVIIDDSSESTITKITEVAKTKASSENSVGAQKCGALWESCDHILNKMLPRGNRNAMRREIFTWVREIDDTVEEFQDMIDLGPLENSKDVDGDADVEKYNFDFGNDQYSYTDMQIAKICLGLIKNSRGNMKIALETLDAIGDKVVPSIENDVNVEHLQSISVIYEHARRVGVGATDLGSVMYPPIDPKQSSHLRTEVLRQSNSVIEFQDFILSLSNMSRKITDLAIALRASVESEKKGFLGVFEKCQKGV